LQAPLPEVDLHDGVAYCLENVDEYCDGTLKHVLRIFDTKGLVEERILHKSKDTKFAIEPQEYVISAEKTTDGVRTSVSQEIKDEDNPF
jgi:hypothetical protein